MKGKQYLLAVSVFLVVLYFIGPKSAMPNIDRDWVEIPIGVDSIENYIISKESEFRVKKGNEATVLWGDTANKKTEYVLLYLHGFSASRMEGEPVITDFVRRFKVNAYLARLHAHGLEGDDALLYMTSDSLYTSAKKALAIARNLGDKVIIMSTSTGGTLSLMLAADFPEQVAGLILYSPNIRINNSFAFLLSGHWGLQIARLAFGGKYREDVNPSKEEEQYWNCKYRLESTVYLQQLLEAYMNEDTFRAVKCPVFLGYYYRDEEHQDPTIRVDAALRMYETLGTNDSLKRAVSFPNAGVHVIAYGKKSKAISDVERETFDFVEDIILK